MKKKVLLIVGYVLLLCIAVGLCMYAIPQNTKINTSMQATKMDKDGKVLGTEQIILQGSFKKYLFKEDVFELSVAPFDDLKNVNFVDSGETSVDLGTIDDKFYRIIGTAWDNTRGDMVWVTATMSQDFDYWVFRVSDNDNSIYYVASANEHTLEEIVQYFQGLAPGYKAP